MENKENPASWVIINKETKKAVFETFNPKHVELLNTNKYEAIPIYDYLCELNKQIAIKN